MQRCIDLAIQGSGKVAPNPLVGCVIVHAERIIGEGFHRLYGGPHAEVNAIQSVKNEERSLLLQSTLYVNLEPCSHFGKTPPCADLIIENKIPKVMVGTADPNPLVHGHGIEKLKRAGCEVQVGILHHEAFHLNRRFFTFIEKKRPYIILKWAQTHDGITGLENEEVSLSNHFSKTLVHRWRSEEAAVMVGTNTAMSDDPLLDARLWNQHKPLRIVLDRNLRLPKSLQLFDGTIPTLVFTAQPAAPIPNVELVVVNFEDELVKQVLLKLYEREVQSVLVEGGSALLQTFIDSGHWDEARIFTTPEILKKGIAAPRIQGQIIAKEQIGNNELMILRRTS